MTGAPGRHPGKAQPLRLELRRAETGTLLGALAWVLGALQIMRDRGHADADEKFHELYDRLAPRLERLVEQVNAARRASLTRPQFEEGIEQAYAEVRAAFEAWIQLTAVDTLSAAVGQRLASTDEAAPEEPPSA